MAALNGLVAGVAPLPADEVGDEDDEDQPSQGAAHGDGDQQAVLVQLTFLHCRDRQAEAGPTRGRAPLPFPQPGTEA